MEMRQVLAEELDILIKENDNVVVINADLTKPNGLAELGKKYPDRVFNAGISEQNMACVAAGMSSYEFIPFIVTFTPFATRRICDQIAISMAYAQQNVKIIGSDPGISAEFNGGTHMSVEDIGVLRSIPNIIIFEPVDNNQLRGLLPDIVKYKGTVYIRMFRKEIPCVFKETEKFDLFKAKIIKKGNDVTIACSGIMVQEALEANKTLENMGIDSEIISVHTIKPIDGDTIIQSVQKTGCILTAENHNIIGGLRSAICEVLSEEYPVPVKSIGIRDKFGQVGKMPYLKKVYEMTAGDIVNAAIKLVNKKSNR